MSAAFSFDLNVEVLKWDAAGRKVNHLRLEASTPEGDQLEEVQGGSGAVEAEEGKAPRGSGAAARAHLKQVHLVAVVDEEGTATFAPKVAKLVLLGKSGTLSQNWKRLGTALLDVAPLAQQAAAAATFATSSLPAASSKGGLETVHELHFQPTAADGSAAGGGLLGGAGPQIVCKVTVDTHRSNVSAFRRSLTSVADAVLPGRTPSLTLQAHPLDLSRQGSTLSDAGTTTSRVSSATAAQKGPTRNLLLSSPFFLNTAGNAGGGAAPAAPAPLASAFAPASAPAAAAGAFAPGSEIVMQPDPVMFPSQSADPGAHASRGGAVAATGAAAAPAAVRAGVPPPPNAPDAPLSKLAASPTTHKSRAAAVMPKFLPWRGGAVRAGRGGTTLQSSPAAQQSAAAPPTGAEMAAEAAPAATAATTLAGEAAAAPAGGASSAPAASVIPSPPGVPSSLPLSKGVMDSPAPVQLSPTDMFRNVMGKMKRVPTSKGPAVLAAAAAEAGEPLDGSALPPPTSRPTPAAAAVAPAAVPAQMPAAITAAAMMATPVAALPAVPEALDGEGTPPAEAALATLAAAAEDVAVEEQGPAAALADSAGGARQAVGEEKAGLGALAPAVEEGRKAVPAPAATTAPKADGWVAGDAAAAVPHNSGGLQALTSWVPSTLLLGLLLPLGAALVLLSSLSALPLLLVGAPVAGACYVVKAGAGLVRRVVRRVVRR